MIQQPDSRVRPAPTVILTGGGLDSTAVTLHQFAKGQVDKLYHVHYGQVSSKQEYKAVVDVVSLLNHKMNRNVPCESLDRDGPNTPIRVTNPKSLLLGTGDEPFIRGRNLWLLQEVAAAAIRDFGTTQTINIVMGLCHESMMFSDANDTFVACANQALGASFGNVDLYNDPLIRVSGPLLHVPKKHAMTSALGLAEILLESRTEAHDMVWNKSFTCWTPAPSGVECGICYHCTKKYKLMTDCYKALEAQHA